MMPKRKAKIIATYEFILGCVNATSDAIESAYPLISTITPKEQEENRADPEMQQLITRFEKGTARLLELL